MNWKITNHLLEAATFTPSPNFDMRPKGPQDISLLVIHNISLPPGVFGENYVEKLFLNQLDPKDHPFFEEIYQRKLSSHLYIRRDGQIQQFVPFHLRAWHAGVSEFEGRNVCNDFSIGIELEGSDFTPFEKIQYDCLSEVTKSLLKTYPLISAQRIVGHQDIAPGRKTDPGPFFDWNQYRSMINLP